MKEKEVDMYLSMASLVHVALIGSGGTLIVETVKPVRSFEAFYLAFFGTITFAILLLIIYHKVKDIIKRKGL